MIADLFAHLGLVIARYAGAYFDHRAAPTSSLTILGSFTRKRAEGRPVGIVALTALFVIGTVASFIAVISLGVPGSFLEPIWRLNPHAREGFDRMGQWAIVLMSVVCLACISTAIGLWRARRWGYWLAVLMLFVNLLGNVINVISGMEPRALVGVPVVLLILVYLLREKTRDYF